MMETKRICNHGCAAFIDGRCMAKLMTTDFVTLNGVAQTIDICGLPDGLKIVGL
jgi:hypothetical protein